MREIAASDNHVVGSLAMMPKSWGRWGVCLIQG